MLATKISFINELAGIAEKVGADIEKVRQGIGSDARIGYAFIYPGAGYGGSCFPKDVQALQRTASQVGAPARLIEAVQAVNADQKQVLFRRIEAHYSGSIARRCFALWGLAFKPNTDDMREAPSRALMEALWAAGATVRAYDPVAMGEARRLYADRLHADRSRAEPVDGAGAPLTLCASAAEALAGADALAIVTEWQEFRSPDFDLLKEKLAAPVVFDGRNLYDPALMARRGFTYYAIGRGASVRL
jgi:UDPglucose 6-dehydrogenase